MHWLPFFSSERGFGLAAGGESLQTRSLCPTECSGRLKSNRDTALYRAEHSAVLEIAADPEGIVAHGRAYTVPEGR